MTAGIKHKRFTAMEEADCGSSESLLNRIPLLDITFSGFSLQVTEHLHHKLSSFISWMKQFWSVRNAAGGPSTLEGGRASHQMNTHGSLLTSDN